MRILIMLFQKSTTACCLALSFVCSTQLANATQTASPVEGTWTVSEIVFHGHKMEKRVAGTRFAFAGDTMIIDTTTVENPLYDRQKISISVSTEGGMNTIETTNVDGKLEGVKRSGIWKIDGDMLILCIPTSEDDNKPESFVSTEDSRTALYIMRRSSER